ncbi:5-nitroimidazole antibiotic resistance protein [Clostridiaceae bacterium DONG20-135]|uniref:5-nitroimidazole antibiotic resistance protein n=1 Tax=Copranaerobaculum intestinale TaxID=2692629 RepID=A0A6N8U3R0_9FIRM|nr:pyridoxamine 5'-phosphate oxidase family protein [Copranaerobaculum intestinale]MXQ72531.1 5-nitroimidazole antibiotic resistance protein [Copranaerobaculum intestinale]
MAIPNRKLSEEQAQDILRNCHYGVLSTVDEHGNPYGVGINCFYMEKEHALYFHTKKIGKKMNNIKNHPIVSVFITDGMEKIVQERFTTHYQSIIVEGSAELIDNIDEIEAKLRILCQRLCPDAVERREEVIAKFLPVVGICKISIKNITAKANRDA